MNILSGLSPINVPLGVLYIHIFAYNIAYWLMLLHHELAFPLDIPPLPPVFDDNWVENKSNIGPDGVDEEPEAHYRRLRNLFGPREGLGSQCCDWYGGHNGIV